MLRLRYMFKLSWLFLSVLLGLEFAQATILCTRVYSKRAQSISDLAVHIREYRESRIHKTHKEVINVNGINYQLRGILGEGTSRVYLATAPDGRLVSIKLIENDSQSNWLNSIYYEIAVTKYYLEMGENVPKVIDHQVAYSEQFDDVIGILVKEYREGITREELEDRLSLNTSEWKIGRQLIKELVIERARLRKVHSGFRAWLKINNIKLKPFSKLKSLIESGDMSLHWSDNFIFDPQLGRWIIFDP